MELDITLPEEQVNLLLEGKGTVKLNIGINIGIGAQFVPGGAAYVGPFDGISFAALYGLKRFLTAYTGNLIRLRRDSDNAESDFGYDAATGLLDTAAITSWLGGANGYVKTWYDQSGNGRDATQADSAQQPVYAAAVINSLPGVYFQTGVNRSLTFNKPSFAGSAGTLILLFSLNGTVSEYGASDTGTAGSGFWRYNGNGKGYWDDLRAVRLEEYPASMPNSGTHIASVVSGASYTGYLNGVSQGAQSANFAAQATGKIGRNATAGTLGGWIPAYMLTESAISAANHNTIGNELASLYNLTWMPVS